jgi:recombination protein RecA
MIGNRTRIKVAKNKVAPPFKTAEFEIFYGEGISAESSVLNMGVQMGIIKKSGSWFSYNDTRIGQGKDNVRLYLKENRDLFEEIKAKIIEQTKGVEAVKNNADEE